MLKEILTVVGSSAVAICAVAWLAKSIITHWLSKDVDLQKAKLKSVADMELERLRVRFSHLHEKRLDAIATLHVQLVDLFDSVESNVTPHQGPGFHERRVERVKIFEILTADFLRNFKKQRLYLSKTLCDRLFGFVTELNRFNQTFQTEMNLASSPIPRERHGNEQDVWIKSWTSFNEKFPPVLDALETEFRRLLGVMEKEPS